MPGPIPITDAVKAAMDFVRVLYGGNAPRDLLLEEIELTSDEKFWLVTIGFNLPGKETTTSVSTLFGQESKPVRTYKVIKINAETGIPVSMKIRQT